MSLSIDHEILVDKYLRDPHEFSRLIRLASRHADTGHEYIDDQIEAYTNEALELLESLYAICREQEVAS